MAAGTYSKSFVANNFLLQENGRYMALVPATTHKLGIDFHVVKMLRRDTNYNWENMVGNYKILPNGDLEVWTDEQCICKIYLVGEV